MIVSSSQKLKTNSNNNSSIEFSLSLKSTTIIICDSVPGKRMF